MTEEYKYSGLKEVLPRDFSGTPEDLLQELLRNIIIRPNFIPAIRYFLGWRGVKTVVDGPEAWTAKIKESKGVYGLFLQSAWRDEKGNFKGLLRINYFPDPNEELIENFSFSAGMTAYQPDYIDRVREFSSFPDLSELFNIATMEISLAKDMQEITFSLNALERFQIISKEGIRVQGEDGEVEMVAANGLDQDLPAWELALPIFEILASSVSFLVRKQPVDLVERSENASKRIILASGEIEDREDSALLSHFLTLRWQEGEIESGYTGSSFPDALWWRSGKAQDISSVDKESLGIDNRPEFIVLSGFLGSGKTSFLQNFIEYQQQFNRFVAVIQNEIGEKSLDSSLLDGDYTLVELDEGCVCCSLVGSVHSGIQKILREFQPDYIILETTGAANPRNLLDEIVELEEDIRFDSVTVMVDAQNIEEALSEYEVAAEQLRTADILILNKTENMSDREKGAVKKVIQQYNDWAPIVCTSYGDVNPALLYGDLAEEEIKNRLHNLQQNGSHGHTHAMDGIQSKVIPLEKSLNQDQIFEALEKVPKEIFRIKGLVHLEKEDDWVLVQCVGGRVGISLHNGKADQAYLTFIGRNVDAFDAESWTRELYALKEGSSTKKKFDFVRKLDDL